jgi:predicted nuclease of predicted toxin-antitoxin system
VKLLLDENLSRRLLPFLQKDYPDSGHVALLGLSESDDRTLWEYGKAHGYTLVSKDADFLELSLLLGPPPQLIWLRLGNCDKAVVIHALTAYRAEIERALLLEEKPVIEIG